MSALLAIAAFVIALLAWRRDPPAELRERIQRLEQQVAQLRGLLERRAEASPPAAGVEPEPEPEVLPDALPIAAAEPEDAAVPDEPSTREDVPLVPPPPRAAAGPALPAIDWERWLGVRGAAVLGGIVLALAGVYLFRYSIERGLISPAMRVAMGLAAGVGSLALAEGKLRERYAGTADALAGAGFAILYASLWAARARYDLIGVPVAFAAMACVTAACTWLSGRRSSLLMASLGLAGGFATPLLVASASDHPIGLFGYLLLLDLALLALAKRRAWPALGLASLAATTLYQIAWIGWRMGSGEVSLGLGILAAFAVAYTVMSGTPERREHAATQAAAVLFPFAMTLYLAASVSLGVHLWRVALLLALLGAAACYVARRERAPLLASAAAAATVAVVAVWCAARILDPRAALELALVASGLAAIYHAFAERDRPTLGVAAWVAALGLLAVLALGVLRAAPFALAPWLTGWLALAALLVRQGTFPERGWLQVAAAFAVGCGFVLATTRPDRAPLALVLCAFVVAVGFQGAAVLQQGGARPSGDRAAATFALLGILPLFSPLLLERHAQDVRWTTLHLAALAHGLLAALAARRLARGGFALAAVALVAEVHTAWTFGQEGFVLARLGAAALALQTASAVLFAIFPLLAGPLYARDRIARFAAGAAFPLWFASLHRLFEARFGDAAIGVLPLALAGVAAGAAAFARSRWPDGEPARRPFFVSQLAVALGLATAAVPLQLEHEWVTVAWALEALALIALWRRYDHVGLKATALALFAAVTIRLVANPAVLEYQERGWPIFNWLLYTYLVPAASLLLAARWLAPLEVGRLRPSEREALPDAPVGAIACGAAALVVIFAWINLTVFDAFGEHRALTLDLSRQPARDLTLSIAWAGYGLALLAAGVWRRLRPLRWASLALVLFTICKVFLYDLGELRDLYRVASLLGLAVSLFLVSWAYQRFVRIADEEAG